MTLALGLVLLGALLVYGGVTGKSVKSLLLGDNQTPSTPPVSMRNGDAETGVPDNYGSVPTPTIPSGKIKGKIHELFFDPLKIAFDEGNWIAPIGGHSDHVHVSFAEPQSALDIIAYAQSLGLRVGENPYFGTKPDPNVHTKSSYHYRVFPQKINGKTLGMAIDVSGSNFKMAQFAKWVADNYTK